MLSQNYAAVSNQKNRTRCNSQVGDMSLLFNDTYLDTFIHKHFIKITQFFGDKYRITNIKTKKWLRTCVFVKV